MIKSLVCAVTMFALGCSGSTDALSAQGQTLDECESGAAKACVRDNKSVGTQRCTTGDVGYVWGACEASACTGTEKACVTADGEAGVAACQGGVVASACGVIGECHPGDVGRLCGTACHLMGDTWAFGTCGGGAGSSSTVGTPLVVAFGGEKVQFTRAEGSFDVFGSGMSVASSWVSAATPWLAFDRDGNGSIDDGRELFGSMTELPSGERAPNGFVALAALDTNGDGWITAADPAFANLLLWRDRDQNRQSSPSELSSASDAGLSAISLDYRTSARCEDGDCEIERARFHFRGERGAEQEGEVVDVHFAAR